MKLEYTLPLLLASWIPLLSLSGPFAAARPLDDGAGITTISLKKVVREDNVHPQVKHQQRMNRAHKRIARMTGRTPPSDDTLRQRLVRRSLLVEHGLDHHLRRSIEPSDSIPSSERLSRRQAATTGATTQAPANGTLLTSADVDAFVNALTTDASNPSGQNSLGLNIGSNDDSYFGVLQIGTPPRNFRILMDSGSADFWVGSESCLSTANTNCGHHTFLGPQNSSTFATTGQQFADAYGSGNVSGRIATDNVNIGGLALNQHTFGVADRETFDFASDGTPFDGLMGLAQSSLSTQGVATPIEALAKAGTVPAAITSFKLGRVADGNSGEVSFGGLDPTKFNAASGVVLPNVNTQGFWEAKMDAITVGGQNTGLTGRTSILDTGTSLIIAPASDATAIHQAIPGAQTDGSGTFTIPCSTTTQVAFTYGGRAFQIDPRDLLAGPVDPNDPTGLCQSGIGADVDGLNGPTQWLVGDVFLKNAYFSVNTNANQITLAQLS